MGTRFWSTIAQHRQPSITWSALPIMRVAGQTPPAATGRLVFELKASGQDKRHHQFHKGLAVAKQLHGGRFVLKIDGDGPVFARLAGSAAHGSPSGQMVDAVDDQG